MPSARASAGCTGPSARHRHPDPRSIATPSSPRPIRFAARHGCVALNVACVEVACSRCDAVCCRLPVLLLPGDRVPRHLIDHDASGLEVMAQDEDGWCAAIDPLEMRCTIYSQRPAICRQFEMGGSGCLEVRKAYRERRLDGDLPFNT